MKMGNLYKRILHLFTGHDYDVSTYTNENHADGASWNPAQRVGGHVEQTYSYTVVKVQKKECGCGKVVEEEIDSWIESETEELSLANAKYCFNDEALDRLGIDKDGPRIRTGTLTVNQEYDDQEGVRICGCSTVPVNERSHFTDGVAEISDVRQSERNHRVRHRRDDDDLEDVAMATGGFT